MSLVVEMSQPVCRMVDDWALESGSLCTVTELPGCLDGGLLPKVRRCHRGPLLSVSRT